MKFFNKILLIAMLMSVVACEDLVELDYLDNPNAVTAENAGIDFIYNNIQLEFAAVYSNLHFMADGLVRYTSTGAFTYNSALTPTNANAVWNNAYADLFPDIDLLLELAAERGLDIHAGSAKILKAYVLTSLVDFFVNVPLTEAGQGTDVISPAADGGQSVYAAAEAMLDEAIALLSGTSAAKPTFDSFYGGDAEKWITLANTLKLRMYNNARLVDGSAGGKIAALVGNVIDEAGEDFQINYGNQRTNPNSRHPFYNGSYETSDGAYMATYFMWAMCCEKGMIDPRIRFYFYRQVKDSYGLNVNVYSCILSDEPDEIPVPDHYAAVDPNLPYCVTESGYYGRDHLNGSGIPPDGPIRTGYGLYPGGGRYDGNFFEFIQQAGTTGGLGEGIGPVVLSSFVDFMRAEAALTANSGEDARALLESGIRASMAKVLSFESLAGSADLSAVIVTPQGPKTVKEIFIDNLDIDAYVDLVLANYDASSDKLDVVIKEYYIALYGNAHEMYNVYRRTGKPENFQPGIDFQTIDAFSRSLWLPADHVNLNANATQKSLGDLVWWDDGSATLR